MLSRTEHEYVAFLHMLMLLLYIYIFTIYYGSLQFAAMYPSLAAAAAAAASSSSELLPIVLTPTVEEGEYLPATAYILFLSKVGR